MSTVRRIATIAVCLLFGVCPLPRVVAAEEAGDGPLTVEELARVSRDAVVVITSSDRRGEPRGLGSGFVVGADGVIATNFHVIGQRRRFTVRLSDGRTAEPETILATDRGRDLALIQIGIRELKPLELGNVAMLQPGQTVVAIGNPLGLEYSVTRGVVAAVQREFQGRKWIQVAMPIEAGSSGSPLLDLHGRAVGVIGVKMFDSTCLAVPVSDLKSLLAKQRPMPFQRWLTIGALNPAEWRPVFGGQWRQRAGRLIASGMGEGFGGRMLCLYQRPPPEGEFEVEVEVRLEDESGAAGLVFHADGRDKHFGFYPTKGSLRLTRFDGPDVFSWNILETLNTDAYRPGDWNRINVRVTDDSLTCSVNGEIVIHAHDVALQDGSVGLVKFRAPTAEFRRFRMAWTLTPTVTDEILTRVEELTTELPDTGFPEGETVDALAELGDGGVRALLRKARRLEQQAVTVRQLSDQIHVKQVEKRLLSALDDEEGEIDLLRAGLLVAQLDNADLEVEPYLREIGRMAAEVGERTAGASDKEKLLQLIRYFVEEQGFHGSGADYYHRSNSYVNEVIDDREGIPITLSVVFSELARRLDLKVVGVGIPLHFVVMHRPSEGEEMLIDVFDDGKLISREDAEGLSNRRLEDEDFVPAPKRSIIVRMLHNLLGVATSEKDRASMLRYVNVILAIDKDSGADRWVRARLYFQAHDEKRALADLDWLLEHQPPFVPIGDVRSLRALIDDK